MSGQSENRSNRNNKGKKKEKKSDEFEFCKVCKLNHNQGNRHKYFPNHVKALSSSLSHFQKKLSDVRFFLKNPSLLRPEHASRNRLWCVICDSDVDEVGSSFASGNAINHLAGMHHLKKLKSFLWKYGGKMDQVESFRISEEDLAKWEKKCKSLRNEAAGEGSRKLQIGPSNDIHNEMNSDNIDSFENNCNHFALPTISNGVMPLQNHTNERYQVLHPEFPQGPEFGPSLLNDNPHRPLDTQFGSNQYVLTGNAGGHQPLIYDDGHLRQMGQGRLDQTGVTKGGSSHGLQNLAAVSTSFQGGAEGNIHSGAPPPWFDATEENLLNLSSKQILRSSSGGGSSLHNPGKSQKLNPKRVGAAWAEKRKLEMEMEKRGEIVTDSFGANWLPNFGRVWQTGSRKESRKEFEVEKNSVSVTIQPETPVKIQPYVSKRMRMNADGGK